MSNEQNGPRIDPLVSDTYRELADETTPEALNREVMRMAAGEVRSRYAIARAWTRPLAWAATIGLSLVLVLQLADVPEPVSPSAEAPDSGTARLQKDDAAAPVSRAAPAMPAAPPADPMSTADADEQAALPGVAKQSRSEIQQQDQKVNVMNVAPAATPFEREAKVEEEPPAQTVVSRDVVQEARETARLREAFRQQQGKEEVAARQRTVAGQTDSAAQMAEQSAGAAMASFATTADDGEFLCPADARSTPEQWLECIAAFEKTAPTELVDREYEALYESFPDFEPAR